MKALIELARDLCMLRRGPQDLPYSATLTIALFIAAVLVDLALALVLKGVHQEPNALARVAVGDGLMLAAPYVILSIAGKQARYLQTLGALALVSIVFALLVAPTLLVQGTVGVGAAITPLQVLAAWLWLGLISWQILVHGHVLRQALELPLALGIVIAFAILVVSILLDQSLFGQPAK